MYAIISDGSHQYRVEKDQVFDVELKDLPEGATTLEFDRVLFIGGEGEPRIGQPTIEGAKVTASLVSQIKGEKIYIQKFRRRKNYRRRTGHRQKYTRIKIESIEG